MRARLSLLALIGATGLLAACGPKVAAPGAADTASTPDAEAPAPTPAQVKTLMASLPAPFNTADPEHGRHVFVQCAACHTNTKGGPNMTGPNLYGLFGRTVGTQPDYAYTYVVKTAGFKWDAARLDTWLTSPQAMLPGTKMSFPGLKNPKDRADVIAYLKVSTTPAP
jgi:cytochrome c